LIKDAESLELAHKVNAIVLDKTGTITEGKPAVTDFVIDGQRFPELSSVLMAMESRSEHPLAEAIVQYLSERSVKLVKLDSFESITGKGIKAIFQGREYFAGNLKLMKEYGIQLGEEMQSAVGSMMAQSKTVTLLANKHQVLGLIAIADKIKSTSREAVSRLQQAGIDVYMLTGDNNQTAAAIAREAGITQYKAELMPGDKATFIKQLQSQGKVVAMVGDGINDSHALAQADVSIAMGKGSDIAMDVAKMTLITSDLTSIVRAFRLSRKTVATIRQNLFWAFIYNIIGIPVAAGVLYPLNGFLLDPMIAGAAMAMSSISVVSNSLRLKFAKL